MDFKSKLRSLVRRQDTAKSSADLSPEDSPHNDFAFEPTITIQPIGKGRNFSPTGSAASQETEILNSIQENYYASSNFDAGDFELQKLSGDYELDKVDKLRKYLLNQLEVVSKKLSEVILHNRAAYTEELKRVTEVENALGVAVETSKLARVATQMSHQSFAAKELHLLQLHNRGQRSVLVLRALTVIKSLHRTVGSIAELVEEGNYTGAIQLTLTCRQAANIHREYLCISQLHEKLQDTLALIEQKLDVALGQICLNFEPRQYAKVYTAFQLLDKNQTAIDQLHMHFITTIHNRSFGVVMGFVELSNRKNGKNQGETLTKKHYPELCHAVTAEYFVPALLSLCKGMWDVMKTYRSIIQWHLELADQRKRSRENALTGSSAVTESNPDRDMVEVYVLHKLESGPPRLWSDMEQKIRVLLTQSDAAAQLKYDSFGHLLSVLKRFCIVGKEFGGVNSDALMDAVKQQASRFFNMYHRTKLEELHFFLDNESWEVCPMKSKFTCLDLWEFQFLRPRTQLPSGSSQSFVEKAAGDAGRESSHTSATTHFFLEFGSSGTPFDDLFRSEEQHEDVLVDSGDGDKRSSDSDDDIMDELKQEHIDETGEKRRGSPKQRRSSAFKSISLGGPVVTNSTLSVLRLFGRYIFFVAMLESNAPEVINALSQLFDYYLYTVYSLFSTEIHEYFESLVISKRLQVGVKRIRENLINMNSDHVETGPDGKTRIPAPQISPRIDLADPKTVFALPERIAAMESLAFLASQMELIQPTLERALPPQRRVFLQQFYTQSVSLVPDIRYPVYWCVAYRSINYDTALSMMAEVQWDIKDLASQHSEYVDHLLKELEGFHQVIRRTAKTTAIPKEALDGLWTLAVLLTNRTFVEGFSGVKKCSNEGRALMQLDYQQFIVSAEKLSSLR
ncbi:Syndetin [Hypsibius exemplaris]|uniref:Syndetin n=1 Tax=Hypsibius exemplaris TaxID=2072580 RepID=A0A1W0WNT3_HYPEX|nr:Syndetin [Hypsibius exemplaris]